MPGALTVLLVEDDRKTVELVSLYLRRERYHVLVAHDGRTALALAHDKRPDLVILDLMLPQVSGLEVCRVLRAESRVPIIMLTAGSTEDEKLLGLELGADDYVVKPFSPRELVARVRVVLRRAAPVPDDRIEIGGLTIDFARHDVRASGQLVRLTPKEFNLLGVLARSPGRVFTRAQLIDLVFGPAYCGSDRTVDVHLMHVRQKIERAGHRRPCVCTVFGVGYKFDAEESHA